MKLVVEMKDVANPKLLAEIADRIKGKLGDPAVIVLGTPRRGARQPARRRHAGGDRARRPRRGRSSRPPPQVVGGGGGGRDNMAQAGGRDPDKLPDALEVGGTGDPASPGLSRVVALDYGSARCGVAVSDPTRTLATPVEPVLAPGHAARLRPAGRADRLSSRPASCVVGLPLSLSGARLGPDARDPSVRPAVEGSAQRAD